MGDFEEVWLVKDTIYIYEKSDEMKKNIRCIIVMVCMFLALCLSAGTTSYAYTEEEKAQAKAWLSAHGYSPDAGGASQAYQDYLNGKFDEELGITRTEQTSSETSETATETTTEIETVTEKTTEQSVSSGGNTGGGATLGTDDRETDSQNTTAESVPKEEADQTAEAETIAENEGIRENQEAAVSGVITWYRPEWETTYKNAAIVILLSVMLVAVYMGFRQLFK